jgi:hypothetical protein
MTTAWTAGDDRWSRPQMDRLVPRTLPSDPARIRRVLQLGLAALWVLDAMLQFQPFMFTRGFAARVLSPAATGNPHLVAAPITWAAHIVGHQPVFSNASFAMIQLLLGLGIAFRPTLRPALAASVIWALAVWWLGEGFGGILAGTADPWSGAPGAAVIYALVAVVLWPRDRPPEPARGSWSVADLPWGTTFARALWVALWGGLGLLGIFGGDRSAQGLHNAISDMAGGEPAWLAAVNSRALGLTAGHGDQFGVGLAIATGVIAVAVFLPLSATRGLLLFAIIVVALIWIGVQDLGGIFGGDGTDPNSGPLLALMAAAHWPYRVPDRAPPARAESAAST